MLCQPEDVSVTVTWTADEDDRLSGEVIVENVGSRTCRLPGKPGVTPLGTDGVPLETETTITLELRSPGYVELEPGESAVAPVRWLNWCGRPASAQAQVDWNAGPVIAEVRGPAQPGCHPGERNLMSSSWFDKR